MKIFKTAPALLLALLPALAFAQDAQEVAPLVEKVDVNVVNVDTYVTDRDGNPVRGLTAEDFEVYEDGKLQKITGFFSIENGSVKIEGEPQRAYDDQFRRKVVLMIDNNSLDRNQRDRALDVVDDFLDSEFAENYEWSVISVGKEVQTLQPFTSDKGEIRSALIRAKEVPSFVSEREIDRRILNDPARESLRGEEFDSSRGMASGYSFAELAAFQGREQTSRNLNSTQRAARAVIETCRAYSASAGKKLLLMVSGGMELNTTFRAYDSDRDTNLREMRRELGQTLDIMVKEANAANFSIYVVNALGLQSQAPQHDIVHRYSGTGGALQDAGSLGASQPVDTSDRDSAALTLTQGTGGRYLPNNRLDSSIRDINDETGNYYSLGYSPTHGPDGKYHKIEVRVKKPGVSVRNREGYVDISAEQRLERSLRSPLVYAKEKGELPVTIKVGLPDRGSDTMLVPITASMPLRAITFLPRDDKELGRVHVYLSIYDETGQNVGYTHQVQDLSVPSNALAANLDQLFNYTLKVKMNKGSYTLVVTLRDDLSNEIGSAFQDVRL